MNPHIRIYFTKGRHVDLGEDAHGWEWRDGVLNIVSVDRDFIRSIMMAVPKEQVKMVGWVREDE